MTLVASWLNLERLHLPEVWTIADTKIMDGQTTLTEEGAKLLELPITCKNLSSARQPIYHRSSIGFAYAGSSLIGLNVHAMLSAILSNLGSSHNAVPDYISIAEKTKIIATKYSKSIRGLTEICLQGFCPKSKEPFIVTIKGTDQPELNYTVSNNTVGSDLKCIYIGDRRGSKLMETIIEQKLNELTDISNYWRVPVYALQSLIDKQQVDTIGGGLQLAIATIHGFDHTWILTDTTRQLDSFAFRNLDLLTEIGVQIGDCTVAISGMTFDS